VLRSSKLLPRSSKTSLSSLALYAQPYTQTSHLHSKNHDSRSSKIASHNVLELQRGCLPHGTPSYRIVGYVWNVVFGILYSAVNDSQWPHRSMCISTVWKKKIKIRNTKYKS